MGSTVASKNNSNYGALVATKRDITRVSVTPRGLRSPHSVPHSPGSGKDPMPVVCMHLRIPGLFNSSTGFGSDKLT